MRPEKQLLLDDMKQRFASSKAVVLMSYTKLEPNKAAAFRMDLAKSGGSLAIIKKRILLKAAKEAGMELDAGLLEGHIAVIFSMDDPLTTTKTIYQFCSANQEVLNILGGRFEGALCSAQDVKQISELPSREEMRAQFLTALEAPLSQTLAVIEALLTSVMHCLENKNQQNQ
jgi:large subunit ribosomal protein L10